MAPWVGDQLAAWHILIENYALFVAEWSLIRVRKNVEAGSNAVFA
jgi:hypothetical protein